MWPMAGLRRRIKELYADIPPHRRAALLGKIARQLERSLDDAEDDEHMKPRSRVEIARNAAQTLDIVLGAARHASAEEEAIHRLISAITASKPADVGGVVVEFALESDDAETKGPTQ